MIMSEYFRALPIKFQSFEEGNSIVRKLAEVIETDLEKEFNKNHKLEDINQKIDELVQQILDIKEEGRSYQVDPEENEDEIEYCKSELNALYIRLQDLDEEWWKKVSKVPNLQCTRLLFRFSSTGSGGSGEGAKIILFENPDQTLCWTTYTEKKVEKEVKIVDSFPKFDKKLDDWERKNKKGKYAEEGSGDGTKKSVNSVNDPNEIGMSYEEKIEYRVNKLVEGNSRAGDSEEIKNLLNYWQEIKTAQLLAGPNADDELNTFQCDLKKVARGDRILKCMIDIESRYCDELQRVIDEIKRLRPDEKLSDVNDSDSDIAVSEFCSCGRGLVGFIIKSVERVCEKCAKENKVPMSFNCSFGPHISDNETFAIVVKDKVGKGEEWYCKEHSPLKNVTGNSVKIKPSGKSIKEKK